MTPPDSGEREVTAKMDAASGPVCWCGKPSGCESGWCGGCTIAGKPPLVAVPLPLAQRILAALEKRYDIGCMELGPLASELRAAVERKP